MRQRYEFSGLLDYNKHVDVTTLPNGINNLIAMGGNVWNGLMIKEEKAL